MTKKYNIWIVLEEMDEDKDNSEDIDSVKLFSSEDKKVAEDTFKSFYEWCK